jgi:hypothetical protein
MCGRSVVYNLSPIIANIEFKHLKNLSIGYIPSDNNYRPLLLLLFTCPRKS